MSATTVFTLAYNALMANDIAEKLRQVALLNEAWQSGDVSLHANDTVEAVPEPGRPQQPVLVHPRDLKQRRLGSPEGHAAFIHALAHIEFNAINLALDAVYRFREMPEEYYAGWIQVAVEEAYHFNLLNTHLDSLNHHYGDFPAHNGLWDMAQRTAADVLLRMALVPRVFEAKGLDVTPGMMQRLTDFGDHRGAEILGIILRDEVGHVAIGNRWYLWACEQQGCEPGETFKALITEYLPGRVNGPFNVEARLQAGFTQDELDELESLQ
jgi:uncharacterized ferritin-like protein (DUF455 family)